MSKVFSFVIIDGSMTCSRELDGILDGILARVTKAVRYSGGEWNNITKDWDAVDVRMALAYPDLYEIGMSNLGLAIIYDVVNSQPDALAERVYAPWIDMEAEMRKAATPLFSLESKRPINEFDIIGFSLGYELTYTNVLNMLELAGIPVRAEQRGVSHPLVVAGGSCALNPEPMAEFIDLFILGDGEEVTLELLSAVRQWKLLDSTDKQELLRKLATIPGIYVPQLYQIGYNNDGTISQISPMLNGIQSHIQRRLVDNLPPSVTRPVVPFMATIHDRAAIEIQRGCTRGCRFCQAGIVYRPVRERPIDDVLSAADELLKNTGYAELSLLSLSTSDYSDIDKLVGELAARYRENNLKISLPSLRIDSRSVKLVDSISVGKKTGLTLAPEAGTERLRRIINKSLSEVELSQTLETATERGWRSVKLYFMIGLPGETQEDIDGIVQMICKTGPTCKGNGGRRLNVRVSASAFVPKAHTPFQWVPQQSENELTERIESLRSGLKKAGVRLSWQDPRMSLMEGVMARGDRRLSNVIHRAWRLGATFDAWSERFDYYMWLQAFDECGLEPAFYAHRQRDLEEVLPWSHIDVGINDSFLKQEYLNSLKETATGDCRSGRCNACGLQSRHSSCRASYQSSSSS
jgi:radical SAM family uncharacterized protein